MCVAHFVELGCSSWIFVGCGTVWAVIVQQVTLCCGCGTVGVSYCATGGFVLFVWYSWVSKCASGGFVFLIWEILWE